MDTSVFNLYGVKDYNYTFTNNNTSILNETDNFFAKYSTARKFLIPSYFYNPYFYNNNKLIQINPALKLTSTGFVGFKFKLNNFGTLVFCTPKFKKSIHNITLYYANSSTLSPLRAHIGSLDIMQNQLDVITNLLDILTKKEYILKSLIINPNTEQSQNNIPLKNELILTLKSVLKSNENGFKINLNFFRNTLSTRVFFNKYESINKSLDSTLLRSQYQPLRKGIVNMIRIQSDKAIAMPTDTRLQILAVSKDIIHS